MPKKPATVLTKTSNPGTDTSSSLSAAHERTLALVADDAIASTDDESSTAELERSLLSFDVDDDLLVPMPPTIHAALRGALCDVFVRTFTYYTEFDQWLHSANESLDGKTPFEQLVVGDGRAVLRAVLRMPSASTRLRTHIGQRPPLRVLR